MNGDERAQGLHLCCEIKHDKVSLVLRVSATADLHLARCYSFETGQSHISKLPEGNDPGYGQP